MDGEYRVTSSGSMDNLLIDLGLVVPEAPQVSEPHPKKKPKPVIVRPVEVVKDATMEAIRKTLGRIISGPYGPDMLEIGMACVVDARLQEVTEPDWTGLVGPPSCGKTEVIQACRGEYTKSIDTLASAASFLSGARNGKGQAAAPLIDELSNKCALFKDLSAMLGDDPKKAKAILGVLTNMFDGEFNKAIGTAFEGSALQQSKSRFSLLFAVTVSTWLEHSQIIANTGARCLMYLILRQAKLDGDADFIRARDPLKKDHRKMLRAEVAARIKQVVAEKAPVTIPDPVDEWLQVAAKFIAAGRTPIQSERIVIDDDRVDRPATRNVESPGETEGPFRVYQQLRGKLINLCRLNGHAQPTAHELRIIQHIVLSSITLIRAQIIVPMADHESFTIDDVEEQTGLTCDAAIYRMKTMETVGLLERIDKGARGAVVYRVAKQFQPVRHLPEIDPDPARGRDTN